MKRKVSLYIAGTEVDIDDDSLILFNYTREQLSNPTVVKNSYSKEVTLKGTDRNNRIFGELFRLDRRTTPNNYNVLKKADFVIYDEGGTVLESGYVKVTGIVKSGSDVQYKIHLFGGLGAFFYALTYNEDGSKKTLADLTYKVADTDIDPKTKLVTMNASVVKAAWDALESYEAASDKPKTIYGLLNFAPAYNGYPENFDCNKIYYKFYNEARSCPNLYTSLNGYSTHPDADGGILVELKEKHTEWETQDLRDYLQRPVIRLSAIIDAIANSTFGGYHFVVDDSCSDLTINDIALKDIWLTLKLLDWNKYHEQFSSLKLSAFLESTLSPAEYLISFAKMMGLVFVTDIETKTVTMLTRDRFFYINRYDIVDLTNRIDTDSINVEPCTAQSKYYVFDTETYGEEAKRYEEKYGIKYGCQVVDTGYEFDLQQKKVLDNFAFKGAADVREKSINYKVLGAKKTSSGDIYNYFLKFAMTEEVSWKLYKNENGLLSDETFKPTAIWYEPRGYNYTVDDKDMFPKVQLHSEGNKAEDGSNVLVVFNEFHETTIYDAAISARVSFYLTSDTEAMLKINGGKPCWNYYWGYSTIRLDKIPSFRRCKVDTFKYKMNGSLDFGTPKEIFVDDVNVNSMVNEDKNVYTNKWKTYMRDLYDVDSKVMKCKANLRGLKVGDWLLGRFFWYENTMWVLKSISNYSITTDDLTECDFVKIKSKDNYTQGQK